MWQAGHSTPSGANRQPLLDRFFAHTLLGVGSGVDSEPPVITEGRSASAKSTGFRTEAAWPPPRTAPARVPLEGGSFTDLATTTEEQSTRSPETETSWLFRAASRSPPTSA